MKDGQDRAPGPQRDKSSAPHSAAAEPLRGPGATSLPSARSPGPHAYRGKFIDQVGEHSFRGQKSGVFPQLLEVTQEDELITLAPGPGVLQGLEEHPAPHVAPF